MLGLKLPRRQLAAAGLVVVLLACVISASRASTGRDSFGVDQGAGTRYSALVGGVQGLFTAEGWQAIADDTVYRFDTNTYSAAMLSRLSQDGPTVGTATISNNLRTAIPSFLLPGKLDVPVAERNEEEYLDGVYGFDPDRDLLEGVFGGMMSWYGPIALLVLAMLFGLALGLLENWTMGRRTLVRLVVMIGMTQCVLLYSAGPQAWTITLRGTVVLAVGLELLNGIIRWRSTLGQRLAAHPFRSAGGRGGGGIY